MYPGFLEDLSKEKTDLRMKKIENMDGGGGSATMKAYRLCRVKPTLVGLLCTYINILPADAQGSPFTRDAHLCVKVSARFS